MSGARPSNGAALQSMQAAFMAQILDEDAPLPPGWDARQQRGMGVYRNNYRSALVEALRNTYGRTERWVGEDAFRRAAAHHVIANPPCSWTLDDAGRGFDQTCGQLFANDPEVAELAWLEWTMLESFTAADAAAMDAAGFASASANFAEDDWANMQLAFLPGATARVVMHDLKAIWKSLGEDDLIRPQFALESPAGCIVWREGERPTFLMVEAQEAELFTAMQQGAAYGDACMAMAENANSHDADPNDAAMRAGAMLGRWLNEGLITDISA